MQIYKTTVDKLAALKKERSGSTIEPLLLIGVSSNEVAVECTGLKTGNGIIFRFGAKQTILDMGVTGNQTRILANADSLVARV